MFRVIDEVQKRIGFLHRKYLDAQDFLRKEEADMGRKNNYSFRLSDDAKDYMNYCANVSGLSESKFLDFLLCSLAAQDEGYKFHNENKKANCDCGVSD